MNTETTNYQRQAETFLKETGAEISIKFKKNSRHFGDDDRVRDIYEVTITSGRRKYVFDFGQSIVNSSKVRDVINGREFSLDGKSAGQHSYIHHYPGWFPKSKKEFQGDFEFIEGTPPTAYDVLTCLTKYDPGTFEEFCGEFGYDTDSRRAEKTYNAVFNEWLEITRLFNDKEIEALREIQ